jgi:hypothetical protein
MADIDRWDRWKDSMYEKGGVCRTDMCARGGHDCYRWGDVPAKYNPCRDAYDDIVRQLRPPLHICDSGHGFPRVREEIQACPACIDAGNTFNWLDLSCKLSAENAEKKRKAEEKKRECDRQATEKKNQCLAQPALGTSLGIDGVHATSFTLGALVTLTLVAVAYFVRRPRGTQMTDSRRAYGATTVQ